MLIKGKWTTDWTPVQAKDEKGRFQRQESVFENPLVMKNFRLKPDDTVFMSHIYVHGLLAPWR